MQKPRVRGAGESPELKAKRAAARRDGASTTIVDLCPAAVIDGFLAPDPDAERLAASDWVRGHEVDADGWDAEYGPLWLGWCIHAAFLAGAAWERKR